VAENCSPKEVIVTTQEILERLVNSLDLDAAEEDFDANTLSPTPQLERMILAYACGGSRQPIIYSTKAIDQLFLDSNPA
jgi:hypothetical protein